MDYGIEQLVDYFTLEDYSPQYLNKDTKPLSPINDENGWQLIWEDEFSEENLNESYWNKVDSGVNYNGELQYYSSRNITQNNDSLFLTAENEQFDENHPYTSAKVTTENKISFHYGKIEIKAKYPHEVGMFPAIWLLPAGQGSDLDKKLLPEIDIFESVGNAPNTVYSVLHYKDMHGDNQKVFSTNIVSNYEDFHTYSIEWSKELLSWYIDDKLVFSTSENIPTEPMYLIINLAVGGDWFPHPNETTKFPAQFEIDHVRYYER